MTTVNNFIDKISNEQTALLPAVEFRGEIRIVEHERDIAAACKTLAEQPVIGFDTETRPSFRPGVTFRVSLLQLSTPTVCYLFRLNKIPLAKPILAVQALWAFMTPLQDFVIAKLIIREPELNTLAVGLQSFVSGSMTGGTQMQFTKFAAGSLLIALPIALLYIFLQKYLISGLTAGGTKG